MWGRDGKLGAGICFKGLKDAFTKNYTIQAWLWRMEMMRQTVERSFSVKHGEESMCAWCQLPASFRDQAYNLLSYILKIFLFCFEKDKICK